MYDMIKSSMIYYFILSYLFFNFTIVKSFDDREYKPSESEPFLLRFNDTCSEPVYCSHTFEFLKRIHRFQNPGPFDCQTASSIFLYNTFHFI